MKLIYCKYCDDVFKLGYKTKTCKCGRCYGKYVDEANAIINSDAIPVGLANTSFQYALAAQPEEGQGTKFTAFVIPKECSTIKIKDYMEIRFVIKKCEICNYKADIEDGYCYIFEKEPQTCSLWQEEHQPPLIKDTARAALLNLIIGIPNIKRKDKEK